MGNDFLLSIIIICYNNEKYIQKCLKSIIGQIDNNIQIIVVNDGSIDNSYEIIKNETQNIPNAKMININNSGISTARNTGLEVAKGKYIMFVDGDDYINNGAIDKIIDYIKNNSFDVLFYNTVKFFEKNNSYQIEKSMIKNCDNVSTNDLIDNKVCGRAWRFICNHEMLLNNNIKFHDGLIYEDEEWVPKIIYYAKNIKYLDEDVYIYRKRGNSITDTKSVENIINLEKIVECTYDWSLKANKKINYIYFSLSRCIRNILGSTTYLNNNDVLQVANWYKNNYENIMIILNSNIRLKILLKLLGPIKGIKIYKKFCKEKNKIIKIDKKEI